MIPCPEGGKLLLQLCGAAQVLELVPVAGEQAGVFGAGKAVIQQKFLFRGISEQLPVRRFNSLPWSFIIITKILSLQPNRVSHFRRHTIKNQIKITVIQKIPRFQCFPFLNKPNILRTSISVLPTVSIELSDFLIDCQIIR